MALPPNVKSGGNTSVDTSSQNQDVAESYTQRAEKIVAEEEKSAQKARHTAREQSHKSDRKTQEKRSSDFQQKDAQNQTTNTKQTFGKKINVNPQKAQTSQNLPQETARQGEASGLPKQNLPQPQQKPLPQNPRASDYGNVMSSKTFQGPMKGTPLHQKIQAQAMTTQQPTLQTTSQKGFQELFSRGELSQLFSMRNRSDLKKEEKDSLRRLLKFHAAKSNRAKVRLKSIQYQTENHKQKQNPDALIQSGRKAQTDSAKQNLIQKLAHSAESVFEKFLQRVLGGSEKSVPDLAAGKSAELPQKTSQEWQLFFKNTTGLQSQLVESKGTLSKMAEALFRGIFQNEEGALQMVADLSFLEGEDVKKYKFSQVALQQNQLLELLKTLKPGQSIPKDWLQQFGEELLFLKLMHSVPGFKELSPQEKQKLLQVFQREVSGGYQKNLEDALKKKRIENPREPFVWAGDQFDKKQERKGVKSFFMILTFVVGITATIFGLYYLIDFLF